MEEKEFYPIIQYWCPNCDALLDKFHKYCHNCGIKLNWNKVEEDLKDFNLYSSKSFYVPALNDISDPCKYCPNHPSNGGSGICNCTLGSQTIY